MKVIRNVYGLLDTKANYFITTFQCLNEGEAKRMLFDGLKDPNTLIARHPEDFTLYDLGTFDCVSGVLVGHNVPVFVCRATELLSGGLAVPSDLSKSMTVDPD